MKKLQPAVLLLVPVLLVLLLACKKSNDNNDAPGNGYAALFKNKLWAGELQYEGSLAEPYSISFDDNDGFTWQEYSGEYSGKYKIDNEKKELTISFTSGSEVTAKITGDNKLSAFTTKTTYNWKLLNSELDTATFQVLDNTIWSGTEPGSTEPSSLGFNFHPGSKMDIRVAGSVLGTDLPYVRKAGALRFTYYHSSDKWDFFSVLMPDNTIKGVLFRQSKVNYMLSKQ